MTHQNTSITDCKKQKYPVCKQIGFSVQVSIYTGNSIFYISARNVQGDVCTFLISSTYPYWETPNSFLYKFQIICDKILPDLPADTDEENYIKDLFNFIAL